MTSPATDMTSLPCAPRQTSCYVNKMADINVCGSRKLSSLVGIKPDLATKIVNYRKTKKRIHNFEELYYIDGVTRAILRKIQSKCFIMKSERTPESRNSKKKGKNRSKLSSRTRNAGKYNRKQCNIGTEIPEVHVSSLLEDRIKVFSPVSMQSSPSGHVLTTVYHCIPETPTHRPIGGKFKNNVVTSNLSTKVQSPSTYGKLSSAVKPGTSAQGFKNRAPVSNAAQHKAALSPNKEKTIKRWLNEVPDTTKKSKALSRSPQKKTGSRSPQKMSPRKYHITKRPEKISAGAKYSPPQRRRHGNYFINANTRRRSASNHSDRKGSSMNEPRDVSVSFDHRTSPSGTGQNDRAIPERHGSKPHSPKRGKAGESPGGPVTSLADSVDTTSASSSDQSRSPHRRTRGPRRRARRRPTHHRVERDESYTDHVRNHREKRRSRPARRSLWTDQEEHEEWRHSRLRRSRTPVDQRHKHGRHQEDQDDQGACQIL